MDICKTWLQCLLTCSCCLLACWISGVLSAPNPEPYHGWPKFVEEETYFKYREGDRAEMLCSVLDLGERKVIWKRASDQSPLTVGVMSFSEDPRLRVIHRGSRWDLVIEGVKPQDAGLYECQISSQMRHLRRHVILEVAASSTYSPVQERSNIQISGKDYVDVGDPIRLVCNASSTGYPVNQIDWFRSGERLHTDISQGVNISMRYAVNSGSMESTLFIRRAKLSDTGEYVCRSTDRDIIGKRVSVLKDNTKIYIKRDSEPGNVVPGSGHAQRGGEENTGSRVTVHWMTSLLLSLLSCHRIQTLLYNSDYT